MGIIISIIALVALVSLYDYFSARNWQQVTSAVRNDVVFEKRNKKYGAYVIRKNYDKRMILIMAGMVGSIGAAYAAYAAVRTVPKNEVVIKDDGYLDTVILDLRKKPDVIIQPKIKSTTTALQDVVKFVEPKVVDEETDNKLKLVDDKTVVGDFDQKGKGDFEQIGEILDSVPMKKVVIPEDHGDAIVDVLDEEPQYPGGKPKMVEFLNKHLVYPEIARELNIQGKCWIRFVVNKNGEITNVKVTRGVEDCPECGKEAMRVINAMPKWRPGRVRGQAVNSYFDLPVNFQLAQ